MEHSSSLLVVDDDHDILLALQDVLETEGYQVSVAHDGREALEQLKGGLRPELILLDLMMPEVSGWAFRAEQRSDAELASIPVVVVSGQGVSSREVARLGVAGYLRKPVDLDDLLNTVERFASPDGPSDSASVASW
ncbi:response regulator [Stigmatella aurantiaca]|uniref:Response regulator n=1 Tax=Stigmatella aurantiaca (strain DW4/3-1) TaxID=378806 RepID=Q09C85_STIAD|nr:response regulator [Stigmatella aurantiaca]ADO74324.1 Response regulator [Stigmatella aurantiaca DW4/3-1]EAU69274.1 two-component system sensory histidine kinase [Stigmatella aurantiaca DW4/3-1]